MTRPRNESGGRPRYLCASFGVGRVVVSTDGNVWVLVLVLVLVDGELPLVEERSVEPATVKLREEAVLVIVVVGVARVVTKVAVTGGPGVTVSCTVVVGVGMVVSIVNAGGCVSVMIGVAVAGGVSPPYVQTPSVPNGIYKYHSK